MHRGSRKMIKKALMSVSVLSAILFSGCDNTAKVPEPNAKAEGSLTTQPIRIGYSDWPGFVAWQVAIERGWLNGAGVNGEYKWFDYSASLSAFAAGQLDAVLVASGGNLLTGSGDTKGGMIMATGYSAGSDGINARNVIN